MFENYFEKGGLFGKLRRDSISEEEQDQMDEILDCKDSDDLMEYADFIKELEKKIDDLDDDEDALEKVDTVLKHFKKYTDRRSYREALEDALDAKCAFAGRFGGYQNERIRYFPEENNRALPKTGGWIMVTSEIPVEDKLKPVPYSVYYAKPAPVMHDISMSDYTRSSKSTARVPYYKVRIATENGEVHLWANEYIRITDIDAVLEEVGNSFEMVRLGGDANYDEAKTHYLSTRGVSQAGVYKLLMNSLNSISHVYFKIIDGEPKRFWEFYIDALNKGIRPDMALRIWECEQTGKPLFNVTVIKEDGTEDTERQSG